MTLYNSRRPHRALGDQTPNAAHFNQTSMQHDLQPANPLNSRGLLFRKTRLPMTTIAPIPAEKLVRRTKRIIKKVHFLFRSSRGTTQPVFVLGYGRSGTTMLLEAFEHDMRIEVLGENDPRIADNYMLVRERVAPVIESSSARVIVMKPILNSFDVAELMREHPKARIVWVFRSFEPVVASALKKFGRSVADELRDLVMTGTGNGWLRRGLPQDTLRCLREMNHSALGTNDWMALVWWSVNRVLTVPGLIESSRFLLVRYEDIVEDPSKAMERIYHFIRLAPQRNMGRWVDSRITATRTEIDVLPYVRKICEELNAWICGRLN
jgi:hypothetical protein